MSDQTSTPASSSSVFDQVKQMDGLLERYFTEVLGADLRVEGADRLACRCPWHEEKTPSLKIDVSGAEERFHCFGSCDFGGSIIDAVLRQEGYDQPLDALNWLNNHFKLGLTVNSAYYKEFTERVEKASKQLAAGETEWNDPKSAVAKEARRQIEDRGISEETREHFRLSVLTPDRRSNEGSTDARILIPIIDKGGHPVAWSGRAMFERVPCQNCSEVVEAKEAFDQKSIKHSELSHEKNVKYCNDEQCVKAARTCPHCGQLGLPKFLHNQHPKYDDSFGYQKKQSLYNLFGASNALRKQRAAKDRQPLYVSEGFGDVWACHQAGCQGAVAYNGGAMSDGQAGLMIKLIKSLSKVSSRDDIAPSYRPIVLIPDADATGRRNVHKNIETLRKWWPEVDVRVVHGIPRYRTTDGTDKPCKDAGDLLKHHGEAVLKEVLETQVWTADEFRIREIIDGDWDKGQQMDLVNQILASTKHTIHVDGLVPLLAQRWDRSEGVVRTFIQSAAARGAGIMDSAKLVATIKDARLAAAEYLADNFVITTDYEKVNECLPGGGFRLGQLSMVLGKSGTGKTTLIANHLWQFLRRQQLPCIFFSLEQPKAQVYLTLAQVALGKTSKEIEELVKSDSEELDEVDALFDRLTIVDNVPDSTGAASDMTPQRIAQLINEINITRSDEPVKVVCIDHLGIIKAPPNAPSKVQDDPSGWAMEQFFHICKQTQTFFMVLQQLPKEVAPGEPVQYDRGRGDSRQTDFCDYIITIWRPDQQQGLSDDEKTALAGQYKYCVSKNRHGPNQVVANLMFDHMKRRITEEAFMGVPGGFMNDNAEGVDLAGDVSYEAGELFGAPVVDAPVAQPSADALAGELGVDLNVPDEPFAIDTPAGTTVPSPALAPASDEDPPDWFLN